MAGATTAVAKDQKVVAFRVNADEATVPDAHEEIPGPQARTKVETSSPHKRRIDGNIVITRDGDDEEFTPDGRKLTEAEQARLRAARGGQLTNQEKLAQMSGLNIAKEGTREGIASENSATSIAEQALHDSQQSALRSLISTGTSFAAKIKSAFKHTLHTCAEKIGEFGDKIGQAFSNGLNSFFDGAKTAGAVVVGLVKDPIGSIKSGAATVAAAAGQFYDTHAPQFVKTGVTAIANAGHTVVEKGSAVVSHIYNGAVNLKNRAVDMGKSAYAWITGSKEEPAATTHAAAKPHAPAAAKPAAHAQPALVGQQHNVKPHETSLMDRFSAAVHSIDLNPFDNKPAPAPHHAPAKPAVVAHH